MGSAHEVHRTVHDRADAHGRGWTTIETRREPYQPPVLVTLGSFEEITQTPPHGGFLHDFFEAFFPKFFFRGTPKDTLTFS
jgi:hypothetical protein